MILLSKGDRCHSRLGFEEFDKIGRFLKAGLSWITKTNKGDFNSRDTFVRQRTEGVSRKLVGFRVEDRRVPRHGYLIEDTEENVIGEVTSGTQSPTLDVPIGLGYVSTEFAKPGTEIAIVAGKKRLKAVVERPPFVKE